MVYVVVAYLDVTGGYTCGCQIIGVYKSKEAAQAVLTMWLKENKGWEQWQGFIQGEVIQ